MCDRATDWLVRTIARLGAMAVIAVLEATQRRRLTIRFLRYLTKLCENRPAEALELVANVFVREMSGNCIRRASAAASEFFKRAESSVPLDSAAHQSSVAKSLLAGLVILGQHGEKMDDVGWPSEALEVLRYVKRRFEIDDLKLPIAPHEVTHVHIEAFGRRGFEEWRLSMR